MAIFVRCASGKVFAGSSSLRNGESRRPSPIACDGMSYGRELSYPMTGPAAHPSQHMSNATLAAFLKHPPLFGSSVEVAIHRRLRLKPRRLHQRL